MLPTPELALAQAKESDKRLKAGDARPLEGLPLGNKDLFCTMGVRTTACSKILGEFTPTYELTVGANLWNAGAVMLGKLNCDEFAMGSSNETSAFGPVVSPWRRKGKTDKLVPGGSSGGSSAAVSAGLCLAATATDTGGSIRQPAALTGTVGIKPTYGRCSRWGIVAFASSLDQAGPLAKTVRDAAIMLRAMASHDPKDSTSVETPVPDYEAALSQGIKGLRVGVPKEYRVEGMSKEIDKLWQEGIAWLKAAGATIHDISLPHTKYALPAYYIVAPAEASSNLARYDGVRYGLRVPGKDLIDTYENTRAAGFGKEVRRRILIGTYVLSAGYYDAYYLKAQKVRTLIKRDFDDGVEIGRRGADADDAVARLRLRREERRSHRHVPGRHLHRDGEHGRPAGHLRAGRPVGRRHAARPAAHRQAVRRGDAVPRRAGDRGCGRPLRRAGSLVGGGRRQVRRRRPAPSRRQPRSLTARAKPGAKRNERA